MGASVNRADLDSFRSFVAERFGLRFEEDKSEFLAEVIGNRIDATGLRSYSSYQHLRLYSYQEMRVLAEQLTVGETYFFRYTEHLQAFVEVVVPKCVRAHAQSQQIRILSAGCASGEEAYTLAILIRERLPELASWDIRIHGIDLNASMVKKAVSARYPAWSFRTTPPDLRDKYFSEDSSGFALSGRMKSMATFEERNLTAADPSFWRANSFDVVFCRNVSMYLTLQANEALFARIAQSLAPGGFLFLGHAETLRGLSQDFHLRHSHNTFYYERKSDDEPRAARSSVPALTAGKSARTAVPLAVEPNASWTDVIVQSSKRIASLTDRAAIQGSGPRSRRAVERPPADKGLGWDPTTALDLLRSERFVEALDLIRELPPGAKADPDAQLLLAVLLTNNGDLFEAQKICAEILESDDLNAGAHYLMALCKEHAGDRNAAITHDQTAIYLDPAFAMPHLHLGLMAKRAGDRETAKREIGQALTLLWREDSSRILLFGGGFTREALAEFCRAQLGACGGNRD
ncbi:MAG TPA: CheR family methyltransferase [Blastocatellia bacterium]